jgi:uncharacterized membrane protein YecN with MAPEG domain
MSNYYATVSAFIFAAVALAHVARLVKRWAVTVGTHAVPMSLSWVGLILAALLAIWGFMQLGG